MTPEERARAALDQIDAEGLAPASAADTPRLTEIIAAAIREGQARLGASLDASEGERLDLRYEAGRLLAYLDRHGLPDDLGARDSVNRLRRILDRPLVRQAPPPDRQEE